MALSSKKSSKKAEPAKAKPDTRDGALDAFLKEAQGLSIVSDISKGVQFISTGSWGVDRIIGDGTMTASPGGFPRGAITEVFGGESSGKTTLALEAIRTVQEEDPRKGAALFIDFEQSLFLQSNYIKNMGIDLDKLVVLEPNHYQEGVMLLGKALAFKPSLIVIDSLSAATPKEVATGEAGEAATPGLQARISSIFFSWISKNLKKNGTALVVLNQKRQAIKGQYEEGPREVTAGGNAMKFYAALRLELKAKDKERVDAVSDLTGVKESKVINQLVYVTVVKNKIDIPWRSVPIYITFGSGIDALRSLIELAIKKKVLVGSGWYEFKHENPKFCFKRQGVHQVKKYLLENPEIIDELHKLCLPDDIDVEARELAEANPDLYSDEGLTEDNLNDDLADLQNQLGM